jgi:lipoprotein Spr
MTSMQDAVAQAARELIGVQFRPQGRDRLYGLDCVGVVTEALTRAGHPISVRNNYSQRGGDPDAVATAMAEAGLRCIGEGAGGAGDIVLMRTGPAQLHLGIVTAGGIVHADAGLRRVVETPGAPRWPIIGRWQIVEAG